MEWTEQIKKLEAQKQKLAEEATQLERQLQVYEEEIAQQDVEDTKFYEMVFKIKLDAAKARTEALQKSLDQATTENNEAMKLFKAFCKEAGFDRDDREAVVVKAQDGIDYQYCKANRDDDRCKTPEHISASFCRLRPDKRCKKTISYCERAFDDDSRCLLLDHVFCKVKPEHEKCIPGSEITKNFCKLREHPKCKATNSYCEKFKGYDPRCASDAKIVDYQFCRLNKTHPLCKTPEIVTSSYCTRRENPQCTITASYCEKFAEQDKRCKKTEKPEEQKKEDKNDKDKVSYMKFDMSKFLRRDSTDAESDCFCEKLEEGSEMPEPSQTKSEAKINRKTSPALVKPENPTPSYLEPESPTPSSIESETSVSSCEDRKRYQELNFELCQKYADPRCTYNPDWWTLESYCKVAYHPECKKTASFCAKFEEKDERCRILDHIYCKNHRSDPRCASPEITASYCKRRANKKCRKTVSYCERFAGDDEMCPVINYEWCTKNPEHEKCKPKHPPTRSGCRLLPNQSACNATLSYCKRFFALDQRCQEVNYVYCLLKPNDERCKTRLEVTKSYCRLRPDCRCPLNESYCKKFWHFDINCYVYPRPSTNFLNKPREHKNKI